MGRFCCKSFYEEFTRLLRCRFYGNAQQWARLGFFGLQEFMLRAGVTLLLYSYQTTIHFHLNCAILPIHASQTPKNDFCFNRPFIKNECFSMYSSSAICFLNSLLYTLAMDITPAGEGWNYEIVSYNKEETAIRRSVIYQPSVYKLLTCSSSTSFLVHFTWHITWLKLKLALKLILISLRFDGVYSKMREAERRAKRKKMLNRHFYDYFHGVLLITSKYKIAWIRTIYKIYWLTDYTTIPVSPTTYQDQVTSLHELSFMSIHIYIWLLCRI